jgi:hypothetical protein
MRTLFSLDSATLNNRPNKTCADIHAPALRALTFSIRTPPTYQSHLPQRPGAAPLDPSEHAALNLQRSQI